MRQVHSITALTLLTLLGGCHGPALELGPRPCSFERAPELEFAGYAILGESRPLGTFALSLAAAERLIAEVHGRRSLPTGVMSLGALAVDLTPVDFAVSGIGHAGECDACGFMQVTFSVSLAGCDGPMLTGRATMTLAVPLRLEDRHDDGLALLAMFDRVTALDTRLEVSRGAPADVRELADVLTSHIVGLYRRTYEPAELLRLGPLTIAGAPARFTTAGGVLDEGGEDVLELPDGSLAEDRASLFVTERGLWILLELPTA